ncbi:hypothetical protein ACFVWG_27475 [Kribbella sp. NPDC058245]|uniref:hypothetical protein n=1 Tax=Kribbella sp. NPDC058245 TaxID=3346399 RepID=UPI0036E7C443
MNRNVVWDASPLIHAGKIDRLDVLGELAKGPAANPWNNHTTAAVIEELGEHGCAQPEWTRVVHVDHIKELTALGTWLDRVATTTHSKGEATVFAWAEVHEAVAIVDDAEARKVAQSYGLEVHGLLWVVALAIQEERWGESSASALVDQLLASGARYPFEPGGFSEWARKRDLI